MTRYHVNPETGRPNICRAKIRCDFTVDGQEPPHFESKADAKAYGESLLKEEHGATATLTKKKPAGKKPQDEIKTSEPVIERETIETQARTLRVGDIITGEKFTNSGKWVEDDSAEIVKIEPFVDFNMNTELKVTYADGYEGILGNGSNVKVKRDKRRISTDKEVATTVLRRTLRSATSEAERGNLIKKDDFNKILKFAKQGNADLGFAHRLNKLADAMEDNNQHDGAIKASAEAARIKMSYDKDYELDRGEAFDLLYDKDNTDPDLFKKLEKEHPAAAEGAARSREMRKEINKQKAERGDTEYA